MDDIINNLPRLRLSEWSEQDKTKVIKKLREITDLEVLLEILNNENINELCKENDKNIYEPVFEKYKISTDKDGNLLNHKFNTITDQIILPFKKDDNSPNYYNIFLMYMSFYKLKKIKLSQEDGHPEIINFPILPKLEICDFKNARITKFPSQPSLRYCDFTFTRLEILDTQPMLRMCILIETGIKKLNIFPELEYLDISYPAIEKIPSQPKLICLKAKDGSIRDLETQPSMVYANLNSNKLTVLKNQPKIICIFATGNEDLEDVQQEIPYFFTDRNTNFDDVEDTMEKADNELRKVFYRAVINDLSLENMYVYVNNMIRDLINNDEDEDEDEDEETNEYEETNEDDETNENDEEDEETNEYEETNEDDKTNEDDEDEEETNEDEEETNEDEEYNDLPDEFNESKYYKVYDDFFKLNKNKVENYTTNDLSLVEQIADKEECTNLDYITLEPYEYIPNETIVVKTLNSKNKFEKGECLSKEILKQSVDFAIESFKNHEPPSDFMCLWNDKNKDPSGYGNSPTYQLVYKLPSGLFITYSSFLKILFKPSAKWYAIPLYKKRVGNLIGIFGVSMLHGQLPKNNVYKLYTKEEIKQNEKISESIDEYSLNVNLSGSPSKDSMKIIFGNSSTFLYFIFYSIRKTLSLISNK